MRSGIFITSARRILPAYFAVLLAIVVAAAILTLPHDFYDVLRHSRYSVFLVPNIGSWLDGSYFDKAIFRLTLHFWSLGVELQFYLLIPLIAWLYQKHPRVLAVCTAASFVACIVVVGIRPRYTFYLMPFRFWEFLIGFYAFKMTPMSLRSHGGFGQWVPAVVLVALTAVMFVPIAEIDHPKYLAALVVGATAYILAAGLPEAMVSSGMGSVLAWLGKYSYSIYLVHFAVIRFWFYQPFEAGGVFAAAPSEVAAVVAITGLISVLLFHLVERPFRKSKNPRVLFGALACTGLVIVSAAGLAGLQRWVLPDTILRISAAWMGRGPERCGKLAMLLNDLSKSCPVTASGVSGARKFLLVGDSHADAIKMAMAEAASRAGADLQLFRENCVLGVEGCAVEQLAHFAVENKISAIIVHSLNGSMRVNEIRRLLAAGLDQNFRVVVIDPVPVWKENVLRVLYRRQLGLPADALSQTIDDYNRADAAYLAQMNQVVATNFRRYSPAKALCLPDCTFVLPTGEPYYFDSGHLTTTGARRPMGIFDDIFRGA